MSLVLNATVSGDVFFILKKVFKILGLTSYCYFLSNTNLTLLTLLNLQYAVTLVRRLDYSCGTNLCSGCGSGPA